MFGLIKSVISFAILFGLIGLGIAYLPPETQSKVTSQAATVAVKGCRGGKMLYDAFKEKLKEEALSAAPQKDDGRLAVADEAQ